jgi:uncharacterized protein (TIGR03790 family)
MPNIKLAHAILILGVPFKMLQLLPLLILASCSPATRPMQAKASEVLVIENSQDPVSIDVGQTYSDRRSISSDHVIRINAPIAEEVSYDDFKTDILAPIREALTTFPDIKYIVLAKGVPIRLGDKNGFSVDGQIAMAGMKDADLDKANEDSQEGIPNPYYKQNAHFSAKKYGFYLVTRLDGYTEEDAEHLIDNSIAAKPEKGPFFFDGKPGHFKGGYEEINVGMLHATDLLKAKGLSSVTNVSDAFLAPTSPLAGYASWGSNDEHFSPDVYHALKFLPGALAETFVSTSARTFMPSDSGQSLIADLIAQGVTGVKGYVSEPYTQALCRVDVLFDRYTSGYNLAESFYMASPMIKWKDVVIGDPLCCPYAK